MCPGPVKEGFPTVRGFDDGGNKTADDTGTYVIEKKADDEVQTSPLLVPSENESTYMIADNCFR